MSVTKAWKSFEQWVRKKVHLNSESQLSDNQILQEQLKEKQERRYKRAKSYVENKKHYVRKEEKRKEVFSYYENLQKHAGVESRFIRRMKRYGKNNFK